MDKFLDDSVSHVVPRSFLGSMEVIGDVDSVVRLKTSPHIHVRRSFPSRNTTHETARRDGVVGL